MLFLGKFLFISPTFHTFLKSLNEQNVKIMTQCFLNFYLPIIKSGIPWIKNVIMIIDNPIIKILIFLFCIIFSLSDKNSSLLVFLCFFSVFLILQSAIPIIINPKRLSIANIYLKTFSTIILLHLCISPLLRHFLYLIRNI